MARKRPSTEQTTAKRASAPPRRPGRPSALLYSRGVSCGERLDQFCELPDRCVDLIYIDRPFNSNHNDEVFWGETKERAAFEERRASTHAYIDDMRPGRVELRHVLSTPGTFHLRRSPPTQYYAFKTKNRIASVDSGAAFCKGNV